MKNSDIFQAFAIAFLIVSCAITNAQNTVDSLDFSLTHPGDTKQGVAPFDGAPVINASLTDNCKVSEIFDLPFSEDFSGVANGAMPEHWMRTHTNWGVWNSNNAGGESAPELRFRWSSATDTFRAITPLINASGIEKIALMLKHSVNDHSGDYTLKIQTTLDGETWLDQWETYIAPNKDNSADRNAVSRGNIAPSEIEILLEDVAGETFGIAFVFEGNSNNINYWYIDDILLIDGQDLYALNLEPDPAAGGTTFGTGIYEEGEEVSIIATANNGWEFFAWADDTEHVDDITASATTVTMPAESITLKANFKVFEITDLPFTEDFSGVANGAMPEHWMRTHTNWSVWNSNNAGGESAPELRFRWSYTTGTFRAITPLINASGIEKIALMLKHSVNDHSGDYTLKIQTTLDGETWLDQWETYIAPNKDNPADRNAVSRGNIAPTDIEILLDDVAGETFRIAFVFEGNSNNFNYWYIDDILLIDGQELYALNLDSDPSAGGTTNGSGLYEAGEQVSVSATPGLGWEFVSWAGDTDYIDKLTSDNATVTMPAYNISLTANFQEREITYGNGVTDHDGNEYVTVIIGNQEWMAENLLVSTYNNGDAIHTGLDDTEWGATTEGAFAIYDNDEYMLDAYGKLYNWYAVDDIRGLCPEGWSVPGNDDWTQLVNFVVSQGYPNNNWNHLIGAGNALKSCKQVGSPIEGDCDTSEHPRWNSHSIHHGFDEFGFSALPGGSRSSSGIFGDIGTHGRWWSSTEFLNFAAYRNISVNYSDVLPVNSGNKRLGLSVRCIKDIADEPLTYSLQLQVHPVNSGIVSGAGDYQPGQQVSISASANHGWEFLNWADLDGNILFEEASNILEMPAEDLTLIANFVAATQEQVLVSMPNISALPGATVEIPVNVSDLSDYEIISAQFTVGFDATVLVPAAPYIVTSGTLTGDAGWTVMSNPNNPGQIIVGGFGQYALTGAGELIRLVFDVVGEMGDQSDLVFEDFFFDEGFPAVDLVDAVFTISVKVCGDADENGFVQAYDAALTLQHSIGLITPPTQGALNADVDEDGMVTAFDAALILRHAIGISMPDGVNTCFDNIVTYGFFNWDDLAFDAHLLILSRQNHQTAATIGFSGIDHPETVYSVMMDVHSASGNIAGFEPVGLPTGYIHYTKRINSHAYRLAVINPYGILTDDLNLEVLIGDGDADVGINISNIILNDRLFDDILLNASLSEFNMSVYPNPFSLSATISYNLPGDSHVEIRILDFHGRHINTLFSGKQSAGSYDVVWHGNNQGGYRLPSGWYLVQIKTENHLEQTKLVLY